MKRLLIRPGAIGDVILSLPVMEAARAEYTEVWAPRAVMPLIRFANRTRAIADTGLDMLGVREGTQVPALEQFDSIYSWYGTNRPEFREAVSHLPFTFFRALPPPAEGIPKIEIPPHRVENFVAIHPFASSKAKRWPMENFRAVASALNAPVLWTAGPEEALPQEAQRETVRFDDLYDLACWLATARAYMGNDSGIAHLAAAVGTPVVAVFLCTDPRIWAPRGSHVRVLENPTVEDAVAALRRVMRPAGH